MANRNVRLILWFCEDQDQGNPALLRLRCLDNTLGRNNMPPFISYFIPSYYIFLIMYLLSFYPLLVLPFACLSLHLHPSQHLTAHVLWSYQHTWLRLLFLLPNPLSTNHFYSCLFKVFFTKKNHFSPPRESCLPLFTFLFLLLPFNFQPSWLHFSQLVSLPVFVFLCVTSAFADCLCQLLVCFGSQVSPAQTLSTIH